MIVMTALTWGKRIIFRIEGKQEGSQSTFFNKKTVIKKIKGLST